MKYRTRIKYTPEHDCMDAGGRTNQETESRKVRCGIGGNEVNLSLPSEEPLIDHRHQSLASYHLQEALDHRNENGLAFL